jgi:hypothetical protein
VKFCVWIVFGNLAIIFKFDYNLTGITSTFDVYVTVDRRHSEVKKNQLDATKYAVLLPQHVLEYN